MEKPKISLQANSKPPLQPICKASTTPTSSFKWLHFFAFMVTPVFLVTLFATTSNLGRIEFERWHSKVQEISENDLVADTTITPNLDETLKLNNPVKKIEAKFEYLGLSKRLQQQPAVDYFVPKGMNQNPFDDYWETAKKHLRKIDSLRNNINRVPFSFEYWGKSDSTSESSLLHYVDLTKTAPLPLFEYSGLKSDYVKPSVFSVEPSKTLDTDAQFPFPEGPRFIGEETVPLSVLNPSFVEANDDKFSADVDKYFEELYTDSKELSNFRLPKSLSFGPEDFVLDGMGDIPKPEVNFRNLFPSETFFRKRRSLSPTKF